MSNVTLIVFAVILIILVGYTIWSSSGPRKIDRFENSIESSNGSAVEADQQVHSVIQDVVQTTTDLQGAATLDQNIIQTINARLAQINQRLSSIDTRSVSSSRMAQLINAIRAANARLEETNQRLTVWSGPRLTFIRLSQAPAYMAPVSSGVTPVDSWSTPTDTPVMESEESYEIEEPLPADYDYIIDDQSQQDSAPRAAPVGDQDVGSLDAIDQISPETLALQERIQGRIRQQADQAPPLPSTPPMRCRW